MADPQNTNGEIVPTNGNGKRKPDPQLRAKLYAETHNWRQSCLRAGYSESTANQGAKQYARMAPRVKLDIEEAVAEQLEAPGFTPEALHKTSIAKLGEAVHSGKPCATTRE